MKHSVDVRQTIGTISQTSQVGETVHFKVSAETAF